MSTIVTRAGKGSPLTHVEVDANFTNLNTDKVEKTAAAITGGTINGTTIGATTPSTVNATTITGQTGVLKGTGMNLLLQSSVLTNASWMQAGITVTGSQSDPFGGTTGALLNDGTSNTIHQLQQSGSSYIVGLTYTISLYAKAGTANYIGLYHNSQGAFFDLTTGAFTANIIGAPISYASTNTGLPSGWWRFSIVVTAAATNTQLIVSEDGINFSFTGTSKTVTIAAPQVEMGSTLNAYNATTSAVIYGTPNLSFRGVTSIGLESNGSLFVQPAGTGALQAQATTSTTAGGNARGTNAVDWQTTRGNAINVANGQASVISGGSSNTSSSFFSTVGGGVFNTANGAYSVISGGLANTASGVYSGIVSGNTNTASGYYGFVGTGFTNSTTSNSAVTTQSGTMNATTAVTLSGSNANIKVGQYITGTSIAGDTYVAAISGTALTLSKVASGSSTSTLSFFTPHGVVVGGGNNQATGSYSFIGGGGDAGTAANRNVASGDWSFVGGGQKNTANSVYSTVAGGQQNTAGNVYGTIGGGYNNQAFYYGTIAGGWGNYANGQFSTIPGGISATTRGINGMMSIAACSTPINSTTGITQLSFLLLARQTTDATATVLTSDVNSASGTNQVILPNNSAYFFTGEVVSGVTGGGDTKGWTIEGVIKRGAGVGTTALVGTPTVTSMYADLGAATWTIAVTADTTNGGLRVTFTGQASTTIRTVCQIRTTEMTY